MVRAVVVIVALLGSPASAVADGDMIVARSIGGVRFLETTTGGARLTDRAPLVIALHPQGGDPADFVAVLRSVKGRAHLVLPYADDELSWYRGDSTDPGAPGVRAAAARITRKLPSFVDPQLVIGKPILVGYSQGAIVALALAVGEASRIAAVVSIAGRLPPAMFGAVPKRGARPNILELHGELDSTVPYAAAQRSIAVLDAAGWTAKLRSYADVGHALDPQELVDAVDGLDAFIAAVAP